MPDLLTSSSSGETDRGVPAPPPAPMPSVGDDDAYHFSSERLLSIQNITISDEREFDLFLDTELEISPPETGVELVTDLTSSDVNTINKPDREVEITTPSTCTLEERKLDIKDKIDNLNSITSQFILPFARSNKSPTLAKGITMSSINKLKSPPEIVGGSTTSEGVNIFKKSKLNIVGRGSSAEINVIPNQIIKVLESADYNKLLDDPKQASVYDLNIGLLNAVEYFDGYSITSTMSGRTIKTPLWKKLTRDDFNSLRGSFILCRMIKYTNNELGIIRPASIDNPVYDEYFLIECPNTLSRGKQATARQYSSSILGEEWFNMLEVNTDSDVEYL